MSDPSSEAAAEDLMTSEGGPPPRIDDARTASRDGVRPDAARVLGAGRPDVRTAVGDRFRFRRVAARLKAARLAGV